MWLETGKLTVDGSTPELEPPRRAFSTKPILIQAEGTWGGGTITVEVSGDGTTWAPVKRTDGEDMVFTDDFADGLNTPEGTLIRLTLAGSSDPNLNWVIRSDGA